MQPAAASIHTAGRLPMIDNPASSATTKEKVEFQPITPVSLREMVLTRLREAILRGNLLPGQRLTETLLSRQMQVAQNVVREALQELEFQGFVVRVPNNESLELQLLQCFADNVLCDLHLSAEQGFGQSLARQKIAAQNRFSKSRQNHLPKADGRARLAVNFFLRCPPA